MNPMVQRNESCALSALRALTLSEMTRASVPLGEGNAAPCCCCCCCDGAARALSAERTERRGQRRSPASRCARAVWGRRCAGSGEARKRAARNGFEAFGGGAAVSLPPRHFEVGGSRPARCKCPSAAGLPVPGAHSLPCQRKPWASARLQRGARVPPTQIQLCPEVTFPVVFFRFVFNVQGMPQRLAILRTPGSAPLAALRHFPVSRRAGLHRERMQQHAVAEAPAGCWTRALQRSGSRWM